MAEELRVNYPVISKINKVHNILGIMTTCGILHEQANKIRTEEEEVAYLDELENYIGNLYSNQITKIKLKKQQIERTNGFDITKVQNLPDDMIYEISTWLEPEIKYAQKITTLYYYSYNIGWTNSGMETYLWDVPKKLILDLKSECSLYFGEYVKSSEPKSRFTNAINTYLTDILLYKDTMRMDKLLAEYNKEYGTKKLDNCYKFFLYVHTYMKYRKELEQKVNKSNTKLKSLKNNKIRVK